MTNGLSMMGFPPRNSKASDKISSASKADSDIVLAGDQGSRVANVYICM